MITILPITVYPYDPTHTYELTSVGYSGQYSSGSGGIGTASKCPKCGGRRYRSYLVTHTGDKSFDRDMIRCEDCRYTEYKRPNGSYAPLVPFDETKLQDTVNWWAD